MLIRTYHYLSVISHTNCIVARWPDKRCLSGSIPLNIQEVWPRPKQGGGYRQKKTPDDHFSGLYLCLVRR